jgi:hypothetical protein
MPIPEGRMPWKCVACPARGEMPQGPDEPVSAIMGRIRAEHVATSPACAYDPENIRVQFPAAGDRWLTVAIVDEEE